MTTNSQMTHYKKIYDEITRNYRYERHLIPAVMWQSTTSANVNEGYQNKNAVNVFIPSTDNDYLIGDIIVKGNIEKDIINLSDLKEYQEVYNITSVKCFDYGTLKHIELGGN